MATKVLVCATCGKRANFLAQHFPIVCHVTGSYLHQVIEAGCDHVTLLNLGHLEHRLIKGLQRCAFSVAECHLNKSHVAVP